MFRTEVTPISFVDAGSTIHVRGRVRYSEVPALRTQLLDEIARSTSQQVVVELGGVDEMDTSGAAVLVEALLAGRARGMKVLFCSPSESVLQLFKLAGFEDVLEVCCPNPAVTKRRLLQ